MKARAINCKSNVETLASFSSLFPILCNFEWRPHITALLRIPVYTTRVIELKFCDLP